MRVLESGDQREFLVEQIVLLSYIVTTRDESDPGVCLVRHLSYQAGFYRLLEFEFARARHLRLSDLRCLSEFAQDREISIKHLIRRLGLSNSCISRIVDRLEDRHYLKREIDPLDRRSIIVRSTAKGERLIQQYREFLEAQILPIVANLGRQETRIAADVIGEICSQISDRVQGRRLRAMASTCDER